MCGKAARSRVLASVAWIEFMDARITFVLSSGERIDLAENAFPTLASASPNERMDWVRSAAGGGISWPSLDLDLSVQALMAGMGEAVSRSQATNQTGRTSD